MWIQHLNHSLLQLMLWEWRHLYLNMAVNWWTDRRILKIFLPGFRIQSEILTDVGIQQLQWIMDSSIFWARILDFACN